MQREATTGERAVALVHALASRSLSALPRRLTIPAARALGRALAPLLPARLAVARENLRVALGDELDEAARERIARQSFGTAAAMACDLLTLPRVARDPDRHARATPGSLEAVEEARARGRGVILVAGHFGLFESMGIFLGHAGVRPAFVAKPFGNPALDRRINRDRTATGNDFIHKGGAGRKLLRRLHAGGVVAIVVDQHVAPADRAWIPFFGVPAATTRTLGTLARRTGAAVIPIHAFPAPRGRVSCELGPVLLPDETDDADADALRLVERTIAEMERATRREPGAWLWLHRRWKVVPDDLPEERRPAHAEREADEARRWADRRSREEA